MSMTYAFINRQGEVSAEPESGAPSWPIYSITKTFIAATVMALGIPVEARLSTWIESALCPRAGDISVGQLLNHTSGLRDYGGLPAYQQAVSARQPAWSDHEFADQTLRQPLLFEPGMGWAYSNAGYWLLSQIIQRAAGLDFEGVLTQAIMRPLGLTQTRVARGLFADTLPDYPAEWVWHGLLLAPAAEVARFMASDLVQPLRGGLARVPGVQPLWSSPHYGYGLMVEPNQRYGHNGGGPHYSAACFAFIESGLTGCVLMESEADNAAFRQLLALADATNADGQIATVR